MSQIPSAVLEAFNAVDDLFAATYANTGHRFFPDNGTHPSIITSMKIESAEVMHGDLKCTGARIGFSYKLLSDPTSPDSSPRSFEGAAFLIPFSKDFYTPAEGKQLNRFGMELARLKGHIKGILGREPGPNLQSELQLVYQRVTENKIIAHVKCETELERDKVTKQVIEGGKKYSKEYIVKVAS